MVGHQAHLEQVYSTVAVVAMMLSRNDKHVSVWWCSRACVKMKVSRILAYCTAPMECRRDNMKSDSVLWKAATSLGVLVAISGVR